MFNFVDAKRDKSCCFSSSVKEWPRFRSLVRSWSLMSSPVSDDLSFNESEASRSFSLFNELLEVAFDIGEFTMTLVFSAFISSGLGIVSFLLSPEFPPSRLRNDSPLF